MIVRECVAVSVLVYCVCSLSLVQPQLTHSMDSELYHHHSLHSVIMSNPSHPCPAPPCPVLSYSTLPCTALHCPTPLLLSSAFFPFLPALFFSFLFSFFLSFLSFFFLFPSSIPYIFLLNTVDHSSLSQTDRPTDTHRQTDRYAEP